MVNSKVKKFLKNVEKNHPKRQAIYKEIQESLTPSQFTTFVYLSTPGYKSVEKRKTALSISKKIKIVDNKFFFKMISKNERLLFKLHDVIYHGLKNENDVKKYLMILHKYFGKERKISPDSSSQRIQYKKILNVEKFKFKPTQKREYIRACMSGASDAYMKLFNIKKKYGRIISKPAYDNMLIMIHDNPDATPARKLKILKAFEIALERASKPKNIVGRIAGLNNIHFRNSNAFNPASMIKKAMKNPKKGKSGSAKRGSKSKSSSKKPRRATA